MYIEIVKERGKQKDRERERERVLERKGERECGRIVLLVLNISM